MSREQLIQNTIESLNKLPDENVQEVSDFAEFLLRRIDDKLLLHGMQELAEKSKAFDFLAADEDLYTTTDLKEVYK